MPAHRKPTELLNHRYRKNAGRDIANEPAPRGPLINRPDDLPPPVAKCWDDLLALAPEGVLKDCDAVIVELAARLWAKARDGSASAAELTQLRSCLGELGMTPAARSRVHASTAPSANEFRDV